MWTLGAVTGQGSGGEEKLTGDFVVVDIVKVSTHIFNQARLNDFSSLASFKE